MPDIEVELKETIDKIGKAFEAFKGAHDDELKDLKKGFDDVVKKDMFVKLNATLDTLVEKKDALEKALEAEKKHVDDIEKKLNRVNLGGPEAQNREHKRIEIFNADLKSHSALCGRQAPADFDADGVKAYRAGFLNFMRKGREGLESDERKAMTAGSDNEGGYLVTPDVSGRIVTRVFETSPMRQIAAQQTIGTNELQGIYDTDEATSGGWVTETGTRAATAAPTLGKYIIPVHELFAMPEATQQLIDDANVDIEIWLGNKVADKLTRVENAAFVTGNGVGKPFGFTSYTTVATSDATRTWGQLEMIKTGVNGDFAASNPGDKLFDLIAAFKQGYLNNANWATKREVIAKVRKFKEATTNAYMWQPGLQRGKPAELLGYPIVMFEDMPALSANGLSLALGDFNMAYQIVDRQGFRVIRDNLTNKPYVRFYTTRRVGGAVVQFEAIKFIQFST